ncbi:MAG: zinc ABC transporter substrate-binding protein [Bacteroidia bacterium]|nr:zinc ABC transporter substrate-binding protein [Bacteroidia bacterium]
MIRVYAISVAIFLALTSCSEQSVSGQKSRVLVTTGMLGDAVKYLLGTQVEVDVLMGPGVDPHLYKATQGDMRRMTDAKLLVVNGLHLEGKMTETFGHLKKSKPVIAIGEGIPAEKLLEIQGSAHLHDPHIWLDVALWSTGLEYVGKQLQLAFPEDSAAIRQRLGIYLDSLQTLHHWSQTTLASIPSGQKTLITSHDAFEYFGRAYGIEVKGLQGISTVSEYGLKDISDMVNFICTHQIRAVFVESSVPAQSINAVIEGCQARKHPLQKGGTLYSDAVGQDGSYFSMIRHNVQTIQKALSAP